MLHCATPKNCHNTGTRLLPPLAALSARSQPGRNMVPACCNDTHVLAFVGRAIHKRQNNQQRHGQVCLQPESGIYHRCGRHCRASSRACCGLHTVTGAASTSVRHQQQHQTMYCSSCVLWNGSKQCFALAHMIIKHVFKHAMLMACKLLAISVSLSCTHHVSIGNAYRHGINSCSTATVPD